MDAEKILSEPSIAPDAVKYQVLAASIVTAATIVGIPALPLVVPIAYWYWTRYYAHLRVVLTAREIKVNRGILNRVEKSIPLEKITDLAVFQGPIMRWLDLKGIRVETAGQSGGGEGLVKIVGIADIDAFRDRVLRQRDRITDRDEAPALPPAGAGDPEGERALLEVARDIRETLRRIEAVLERT